VNAERLVDLLLAASPANQYADVRTIPGAGNHNQVVRYTFDLRGPILNRLASLQPAEQASFVKALAVYEDTVGGLGSVTALHRVLPVVSDPDHAIIDWVLSNTKSYWYYSSGAESFAELQGMRARQARWRDEKEDSERKRETEAKVRKAERATQNLYNAVGRGDVKAVKALLNQGASASGTTPEGVGLAEYAEACGRGDIAELLGGSSLGKNTS
jgi:hypothetical protein